CTDNQAKTETLSLDLLQRYRRPWERRHQEAIKEFDRARVDRHRERRLAMAEEREAMKLALQKETKAPKEGHKTQHPKIQPGFHPADTSGFVPSTTTPPPSDKQKSAAA